MAHGPIDAGHVRFGDVARVGVDEAADCHGIAGHRSDVVTALLIAIRGGGHNGPGLGSCNDGLVRRKSTVQFRPRHVRKRSGPGWLPYSATNTWAKLLRRSATEPNSLPGSSPREQGESLGTSPQS
jgi:hypothetical protein